MSKRFLSLAVILAGLAAPAPADHPACTGHRASWKFSTILDSLASAVRNGVCTQEWPSGQEVEHKLGLPVGFNLKYEPLSTVLDDLRFRFGLNIAPDYATL